MNLPLAIAFAAALVFLPVNGVAVAADYGVYLPRLLDMLKNGSTGEKKAALDSLWFLQYAEYRQDPRVWDPILSALNDKDSGVREAAASTLKTIGERIRRDVLDKTWSSGCCMNTPIVPSLIKAMGDDENPRVRAGAAAALGMYYGDRRSRESIEKEERAIDPLIKALKDQDPRVRLNAAFSLGELKARKAVGLYQQGAVVPEPLGDSKAGKAVGPLAVGHLTEMLDDDTDWRNKYVQQEAVIALRKIMRDNGIGNWYVIKALVKKSADPYLRREVIKTLAFFPSFETRDAVLGAVRDKDEETRIAAHRALSGVPSADLSGRGVKLDVFIKSLEDPSPRVRKVSARVLGEIGDAKAVAPLIKALGDSDRDVQKSAIDSLVKNKNDERAINALAGYIAANGAESGYAASEFSERVIRYSKRVDKKVVVVWKNEIAAAALLSSLGKAEGTSRMRILRLLGDIEDERVLKLFKSLINDQSPEVGKLAGETVERLSTRDFYPIVISKLRDNDPSARKQAVEDLWGFRFREKSDIKGLLLEMLKDEDPRVRAKSLEVLGRFRNNSLAGAFIEMLGDNSDDVRWMATQNLRHFDDPRAADANIRMLRDRAIRVRHQAIENARKSRDKSAIEPLIELLNDDDGSLAVNSARPSENWGMRGPFPL